MIFFNRLIFFFFESPSFCIFFTILRHTHKINEKTIRIALKYLQIITKSLFHCFTCHLNFHQLLLLQKKKLLFTGECKFLLYVYDILFVCHFYLNITQNISFITKKKFIYFSFSLFHFDFSHVLSPYNTIFSVYHACIRYFPRVSYTFCINLLYMICNIFYKLYSLFTISPSKRNVVSKIYLHNS